MKLAILLRITLTDLGLQSSSYVEQCFLALELVFKSLSDGAAYSFPLVWNYNAQR